jgi:predicted RNA-binding protein YlxR (DUF448 family)
MKPKRDLIRVVKNASGEIFVDNTSKAAGRGAYLCNDKSCFSKFVKTKALNRQFECAVADSVLKRIEEKINESEH